MASRVFGGGFAILLVWFATPSWFGVLGRTLLTMLILLTWPVWVLVRYLRRKPADRPAAEPQEDGQPAVSRNGRGAPPPRGTYEELTHGAKEVVQWLRGSKLGSSGDSVYALPWYAVAGPISGGKSQLLRSSGMSFHALPNQRPSDASLVRPTRHCDWRVHNTSVWLDTSGRYQRDEHRDEWAALVETVKRHRKWRPLDGFVLVVNAAEVLKMGETEAEEQAKLLRSGLDDTMQRAGCRFPVYLVFTHMDEVEGFPEFFDTFDEKEREQVWGATFPLDSDGNAQARFDAEFDHLYWRLIRRRVVQLGLTAEPQKQLRVFKFPGQFRRARARLGHFTSVLFSHNPFNDSPLLRGFYFTGRDRAGAESGYFFAPRLFRDVVLPDKNIAAATQDVRGRSRLRRNLLLGALAVLLVAFMVGMVVSYFGNKKLIADANALGQELIDVRRQTGRETNADQLNREMEVLKRVHLFLDNLDKNERESPPLGLRFGLYSGGRINSSGPSDPSILRHLYFDAVFDRFMKNAVAGVEEELRNFSAGRGARAVNETEEESLGRHFDLLKVYLMMSNADRVEDQVDHKTFESVLREYFKRAAPTGREEDALRHLNYLAGQADKADAPHPKADEELVAKARVRLTPYPVIEHVYRGMVSRVESQGRFRPVKLASIPNAPAGNILVGQYVVPGSFTLDGYEAMTDRIESSAAEDFRKQEWVVREPGAAAQTFDERQRNKLSDMYQVEYAMHWQKLLEDIKVRDYVEKADTVATLRALTGRNSASPLEAVLREAASQTNLSASRGVWGWIKGLFSSEPNIGDTRVEEQFRPLIVFVSGKKGASLTKYLNDLQSVANALNSEPRSMADVSKALQSKQASTSGLNEALASVGNTIAENRFAAGDAAARLLRQPVDNLTARLALMDFEQLEQRWQETYAKAQQIEAGFPFGAGSDVHLATVVSFLNPRDGQLTSFFNDNLRPSYFENDWTPKKDFADKFSPQFVKYLADARRLSAALFPNGDRKPSATYQIELVRPPEGLTVTVEIDGNQRLTDGGESRQFNWPGDSSGVRVKVFRLDGSGSEQQPSPFPGDWGLLHMFRERGGGDGKGSQFTLQPQSGVSLRLQPKPADPRAGDIFRREVFALRAPKEIRPAR